MATVLAPWPERLVLSDPEAGASDGAFGSITVAPFTRGVAETQQILHRKSCAGENSAQDSCRSALRGPECSQLHRILQGLSRSHSGERGRLSVDVVLPHGHAARALVGVC